MGLIESALALRPERRAVAEWGSSAIPGPLSVVGGSGSYSSVDLRRAEGAMQKVAVGASVDLIASLVSRLPVDVFLSRPDGTQVEVDAPKVVTDPAGDGYGYPDWAYQYLESMLLRGNAVALVGARDPRSGLPSVLPLVHPDDASGWRDRDSGEVRWRVDGKLVDTSQVWHRRSYPLPGSVMGQSVVSRHMTTITEGISAARFGTQFFTDGAHPSALFVSDGVIDQKTAAEVKSRWMSAVHGSREPVVIGKGWDYKALSVTPEESQFLETQKYTAAECARMFGPNLAEILGYETGSSMTYSNVEQRAVDFLKFTADRWIVDLERTLSGLLPRPRFVKVNRSAILATDILTRYKAYNMALAGHYTAPSEIRDLEDQPPLTDAQRAELEAMAIPSPSLQPAKEPGK